MRALMLAVSFVRSWVVNIVVVIFTLFYATFVVITCTLIPKIKLQSALLRTWSYIISFLYGMKVEVQGVENLPKKGAIYVFNHSSHMDIPAIHFLPGDFRFGAKAELFKIPFFGAGMRATGTLPILRADRDKVLKLYEESIERVQNGLSFVLAPEGTRQTGATLGRFKSGPFIFAIRGGFQVVPIVIFGAAQVLPKHSLWANKGRWSTKVTLRVLPPVSTEGYTEETRQQLQTHVREMMEKAFLAGPSADRP